MRITNRALHVLSDITIDKDAKDLLALSLGFIPTPRPTNLDFLTQALNRFERNLWLRHIFRNKEDNRKYKSLYIPNPDWQPPQTGNPALLRQLQSFRTHVEEAIPHARLTASRKDNLTYKLRRSIANLGRRRDITIKPADKNLGPAVMNTEDYNRKLQLTLDDENMYRPITMKIRTLTRLLMTTTRKTMDGIIQRLPETDQELLTYCIKFRDSLTGSPQELTTIANSFTIPPLYMMPKVHKTPWSTREIAACHSTVTTWPSKLLSCLLRDLINGDWTHQTHKDKLNHHTVLSSSDDVITLLETHTFTQDATIATFDVKALYPNFRFDRIMEALRTLAPETPHAQTILALAELVLKNSYVQFNGNIYHQVEGIAMGTNAGPDLANLTLQFFELAAITIVILEGHWPPGTVYRRFIDDLLLIWNGPSRTGLYRLADLIQRSTSLQLVPVGESNWNHHAEFLDLYMHKSIRFHTTGHLDIRLNAYLYIPFHSHHCRKPSRDLSKQNSSAFYCAALMPTRLTRSDSYSCNDCEHGDTLYVFSTPTCELSNIHTALHAWLVYYNHCRRTGRSNSPLSLLLNTAPSQQQSRSAPS
jgi:hypothetical protein